jgi:anti-sigma factor RsiW
MIDMDCKETGILLHALIDGEVDAGHAREIETHIATCPTCAAQLREFREFRKVMSSKALRHAAPAHLRQSIEGRLPKAQAVTASRRSVIKGFALGATASALAASGLLVMVVRNEERQRLLGEVVSAHLRSLQAQQLTDVVSTDQHTVKPWFNGRLDVAPPVVDLTAQGFTLLGGRLDYVDGKPVAAIVYRRRVHIINLFCAPTEGSANLRSVMESRHGFNVRYWRGNGIDLWAVSDINVEELAEFGEKFQAALQQ